MVQVAISHTASFSHCYLQYSGITACGTLDAADSMAGRPSRSGVSNLCRPIVH